MRANIIEDDYTQQWFNNHKTKTCICSYRILERVLNDLTQYALEAIGDAHHSAPFASIQDMPQESLYELQLQIQFQFKKRHEKLCMLTFVLTIGLSFS